MDFGKMSFYDALTEVFDAQHSEVLKDRINGAFNLSVEACDEENRSWAEFGYKKQERFLNPYNGVHGGIACAIADTCMGSMLCAATQQLFSTTDISVSYLTPMMADEYRIRVDIKKVGKQLGACTCEIFEKETGRLCVTVMAKYISLKKDILADKDASKRLNDKDA